MLFYTHVIKTHLCRLLTQFAHPFERSVSVHLLLGYHDRTNVLCYWSSPIWFIINLDRYTNYYSLIEPMLRKSWFTTKNCKHQQVLLQWMLSVKVLELFCPNSARSINQTSFRIKRILIKIGLAKRECRPHGHFSQKIITLLHCWIATLNILKSTPGMIMSNLKASVKPAFNVCSVNDVNIGIHYG